MRFSRLPRVRALLSRIWKIQVRSAERPSNRSIPLITAEPGVLDDLLGDRAAGHVGQRQPHQRRAELVDERRERRLVAGAQRLDQLGVLGP